MKIAISLETNDGLSSQTSDIFGRCNYFMFIDPQDQSFEIVENPAHAAAGGAGIQAAQFVADWQPAVVISGHIGSKAQTVIARAQISIMQFTSGCVKDALELYRADQLKKLTQADVGSHSGLK